MPIGVLLALISYSTYAVADAITKGFAGQMSVFEIIFFVNLIGLIPALIAKGRDEPWGELFKLSNPLLMHARAFLYTAATLCFVYAVTTIAFAETYSIAFLAPLFLSVLAVLVLKEKVVPTRWVLVTLSFIGVLVVVRPGFRDLNLGHLAAVGCALFAAAANTILRFISNRERQTTIIMMNGGYQIGITGVLMLGSFVWPSWTELGRLVAIGLLGGVAQIMIIRAARITPASHIGPTQYVQILWAVALGALFYHETPDAIGYVGLVVIVLAGIATVFSDGAHARIAGRWSEFRARRGEPQPPIDGPEL
jgi:drug/metabolite transporter (DMT)-like permease